MKKILAIAIAVVMTVALFAVSASALHHTSADQIMAGSDEHDLAGFGGNDKNGTDLGAIDEEFFYAWGWYSTEVEGGIEKFGYRYGDTVILDSEKFIGGDADVIASQCGGVGESVRFKIAIPVLKGEQEVFAVAKLADGSLDDIWRITYSAANGKTLADLGAGSGDQPSQPAEKDADAWLCQAGGPVNTGWWMHPFTSQQWEFNAKFASPSAFDGIVAMFFANPEGATVKINLIDESGKTLETVEHTQKGDGTATIDLSKAYPAGTYTIQILSTDNGAHFVVGSSNEGTFPVEISGNCNTNDSTLAAPIIFLRGAVPPSASGEPAPTSDAAVIAIAAVGCIALAGVVVAKKIK